MSRMTNGYKDRKQAINTLLYKSLKQGCYLSPILYEISLNSILKEWQVKCSNMDLYINGKYLYIFLFDDNQVL